MSDVNPETKNERHSSEYDAFICHASEDKDSFVRPLAKELNNKGLHVWYDEFSLKVGDSLRRSIERGLANSRYGIVVLSPDFFNKEWPQKELDGLNALEDGNRKIILPIWHGINKCDVLKYSPILADRVALSSSSGIEQVVSDLLKVVRPKDTYEKLLSHALHRWITHGILPSAEELYILCENIKPDQLTRDEMAFLYCAYLSKDSELVDWSENKRPAFSFGYLFDYLSNKANVNESILSSFHLIEGHFGMLGQGAVGHFGGFLSQIELKVKRVSLHEVIVKGDHSQAPAIYFCVQDRDARGLEILIVREEAAKSFVRYMPQISDEEMRQISHRLIELKGK